MLKLSVFQCLVISSQTKPHHVQHSVDIFVIHCYPRVVNKCKGIRKHIGPESFLHYQDSLPYFAFCFVGNIVCFYYYFRPSCGDSDVLARFYLSFNVTDQGLLEDWKRWFFGILPWKRHKPIFSWAKLASIMLTYI